MTEGVREHPHLYEINVWPWLDAVSRREGRPLTLGAVPDREWDRLADRDIDLVYLMGLWRRSAIGRQIARSEPQLFGSYDEALPDWRVRDVVGSAYCISAYEPDPQLGTWDDLGAVREKLRARDMRLIVDFIPNHTGFDHPWVEHFPDRYVQGDEEAVRRNPSAFRAIERSTGDVRLLACGRDPFFAPWTDVAQLDYFNDDTRAAMVDVLKMLATHADGARCDMAMLSLTEVFGSTWSSLVSRPAPAAEFWADARAAVPDFTLIAEVYWDLEWRLQQLGFDFTYDKRLYDRLLHARPGDVLDHLRAEAEYQRRSARFIENHDEPRSATAFGDRLHAAAVVMSTLPGLRFFHDGQFEGRQVRLPVQLGALPYEPVDPDLFEFYRRLLAIVDAPVFHDGEWRLCAIDPCDDTSPDLVAWHWNLGGDERIVVVNLGTGTSQGNVRLRAGAAPADSMMFEDLLDGRQYPWAWDAIETRGLYVRLDPGGAHIFRLSAHDRTH
jgi:Alpha amylase, catalytic domain